MGPDGAVTAVTLPPAGAVGPGEVFVPAGWFWSGGDPDADEPLPSQRLWVDDLAIDRFPVTFRDYLAFLDALVADGRADEARARVPQRPQGAGGVATPLAERGADCRFALVAGVAHLAHPAWPAGVFVQLRGRAPAPRGGEGEQRGEGGERPR